MARKIKTVTIADDNRDRGKSFIITEMPADQGESWCLALLRSLMSSGVQIPEEVAQAGSAGLATLGYDAILAFMPDILRLELMSTVKYQHRADQLPQEIVSGINSQIEEKSTRAVLGRAAFDLQMGFSEAGPIRIADPRAAAPA